MTILRIIQKLKIPNLVTKMNGLNAGTLAILHHTYGYNPEIVASVIDIPPQMLADYYDVMEKERMRSRAVQRKTIISIES